MSASMEESLKRPVLGQERNRGSLAGITAARSSNKLVARSSSPEVEWRDRLPKGAARSKLSADTSRSSDSPRSVSRGRKVDLRTRTKQSGVKSVNFVPDGPELPSADPPLVFEKRCSWITANTDPVYVSFHDEEWGVPVYNDRKLFELLVLSEAFGELSWSTILNQRKIFRKLFDDFDILSVAKFTEKKILSLQESSSLLSEPKLRAVVENAKQILKVAEEFGSFSNYCWNIVNHKPVTNGYRYARQVPVKTPKAEVMSKDLMRRGFRFVGPTIIYSFMQAAGIVNGHLLSCFRYKDCVSRIN
ncbi:hypothetical protein H6P81_021078 [Aristolochia fimbriata]|uniref:DNA-3-methyladenine glycosylase I n=1 Tax=Aristolochia fimbriata TaxID=158543 RepID=A0AAV7E0H6_ARIFI|nr:hypothetical protein H6P81_021078 [Aristolochia fimbriata]